MFFSPTNHTLHKSDNIFGGIHQFSLFNTRNKNNITLHPVILLLYYFAAQQYIR